MRMEKVSAIYLDEFIGEFRDDRRLVEYVKTMLKWAEIADKFGKEFIVCGGFAVDLAVGKVTRTHDDLDVCVLSQDVPWFKERFEVDGYKFKYHEGKKSTDHFCAYKYNFMIEDSLYVEAATVHIDENEVWDDVEGERYLWPVTPTELTWDRTVENITVNFLNPKVTSFFKRSSQIKHKESRDKDFQDLETLDPLLK